MNQLFTYTYVRNRWFNRLPGILGSFETGFMYYLVFFFFPGEASFVLPLAPIPLRPRAGSLRPIFPPSTSLPGVTFASPRAGLLLMSPFINLRPDPRDNGRML